MNSIFRMQSDNVQLSFAISCGNRKDLRARLVRSLATTKLPCTSEILFAESQGQPVGQLRNDLYLRAKGRFVYFLDEDCEWPRGFPIQLLESWMATGQAFSGPYHNGPLSTFFGRAYNFMTHTWLRGHALRGSPVPVAGNVLLPKTPALPLPYLQNAAFGGEEQALMQNLAGAGIRLVYCEAMAIEHNALHSMKQFFARAWLHGKAPAAGRMRLSPALHRAVPSFNPILLLTLLTYHFTQASARRLRRP